MDGPAAGGRVPGGLTVIGRLREASNATFLVEDSDGGRFVYKPVAGERPLWDFPSGTLSRREVAAWAISDGFGFGVVPTTVWVDGPFGEGSLQCWVEGRTTDLVDLVAPADLGTGWLPVAAGRDAEDRPVVLAHRDSPLLRRVCLFDLVINNSDRKVGHMLQVEAGPHGVHHLYGVDHGVSLGAEPKVRTVLWGFAGRPFADDELDLLGRVSELGMHLPEGLTAEEWELVGSRATALGDSGAFPAPSGDWPAIPWPPW